jgi:hypothetical protein
MKIRMLATAAGPMGVFHSGDVVEVEDEVADAWIIAGYAVADEPVRRPQGKEAQKTAEVAAVEPPEKAVRAPVKRKTPRRSKSR